MTAAAAALHAALTAAVVAFQLALAAGAPWGHLAMGGRFPGRFPPRLRAAAAGQAVLLVVLSALVLSRAELVLLGLRAISSMGALVATGVNAVSLALNLASPSAAERRLWAPCSRPRPQSSRSPSRSRARYILEDRPIAEVAELADAPA